MNVGLVYAQSGGYIKYSQSIDSAEYRMYIGDYKVAEQIYVKAFLKVKKPLSRDCYMLTRCYAKLGQYDSAIVYLEKSASTAISSNKTFKVILQDQYFFKDLLSYDNGLYARLEKMDSINELNLLSNKQYIKMINFLDDFFILKQKNDKIFWDSVKFHNDTANPVYKKHHLIARKNYDTSLFNVLDFIKNNGYPGILTCGIDWIKNDLIGMAPRNVSRNKAIFIK